MGTKNNPSKFDCYKAAEPDEPMFVLLGRDATASLVVTFWRALKIEMQNAGHSNISSERLHEAHECSLELEAWAKKVGKDPSQALAAMKRVLEKMKTEASP